jgi:hypothetical protein
MTSFVKRLRASNSLWTQTGVDEELIAHAESELGVTFAKDYREYLAMFGIASADGHEFTGICKSKRLNVVYVTNEERNYCDRPDDWYVVEDTNIDGIIIWQSSQGDVFLCQGTRSPEKIANSLSEYLK